MANEIVAYSNTMHSVALGKLNPADSRVFFALLQKLKERGTREVEFTWTELRQLARLNKNRNVDRFSNRLKNITSNLCSLVIFVDHPEGKGWTAFTLFQLFEVDIEKQTLKVAVSERFEFLLNQLEANFVRWELPEYLALKGKYSQALYRHLKQFRGTGIWTVKIEDFRRLLGVPKSYRIANITERVILPACKELAPYFTGLHWRYVKQTGAGGRGRGGKVDRVIFTFQMQMDLQEDFFDPRAMAMTERRAT